MILVRNLIGDGIDLVGVIALSEGVVVGPTVSVLTATPAFAPAQFVVPGSRRSGA
jgi:hypothetical protein